VNAVFHRAITELRCIVLAAFGEKATVIKAVKEFTARRRRKHPLELMGQLEWDQNFDYKAERARN
jgi:hypothetical protein